MGKRKLCSCGHPSINLCDMFILAEGEEINWENPYRQMCNKPLCQLCRNQIHTIRTSIDFKTDSYDLCHRHNTYKKLHPFACVERVKSLRIAKSKRFYKEASNAN